ncbi:hypothetical protein CSC70_09505 [Pseudoxanthomonas kalamensis DSM 18571]|uniref:efflux RND transporter periplasmic adaptor subunit n=1 Tax=Pseudoxanthomonas kalamensis TaxID=289483 RepID=UPI0013915DCF|nr:efflux RND transporter periplasmic adaptor subunit [Pseudoxanthomonas kalamensis]KAF1709917.1 hypothetical protein CSC70_09505 [Pseudoxanthomonas kalamensis DSM 18571]
MYNGFHKRCWFRAAAVLSIALVLMLAWYLLRADAPPREQVQAGQFEVTIRAPATLDALDIAALRPKVTGHVVLLPVDVGDVVDAGARLAQLDDRSLRATLEQAEASVRVAQAGVQQSLAQLSQARTAVELSRRKLDRAKELQAGAFISRADLDAAIAEHETALAQSSNAAAAIPRARAEFEAACAAANVASVNAGEAVVHAPFAGMIVARHVSIGDLASPETVIIHLVSQASVVLSARVDEASLSVLQPGQTVTVRFRSAPDTPFSGKIRRIGREVDGETRELAVDLELDTLPPAWALGQRADVDIVLGTVEHALSIPQGWVVNREGRHQVWVDVGGRARRRDVILGARGNNRVQVVSGLAAGEVVLAPTGLSLGRRIRPASQ